MPCVGSYEATQAPDVWLSARCVWEVRCADLSLSAAHRAALGRVERDKGISLRFPRCASPHHICIMHFYMPHLSSVPWLSCMPYLTCVLFTKYVNINHVLPRWTSVIYVMVAMIIKFVI